MIAMNAPSIFKGNQVQFTVFRSSRDVMRDGCNKDFRIGHYGRLWQLGRCYVTQTTGDILSLSFWDGMFLLGFSSWRQRWRPVRVHAYLLSLVF